MSISQIPNEVLVGVVRCLGNQTDLSALSRSCHRLYDLTFLFSNAHRWRQISSLRSNRPGQTASFATCQGGLRSRQTKLFSAFLGQFMLGAIHRQSSIQNLGDNRYLHHGFRQRACRRMVQQAPRSRVGSTCRISSIDPSKYYVSRFARLPEQGRMRGRILHRICNYTSCKISARRSRVGFQPVEAQQPLYFLRQSTVQLSWRGNDASLPRTRFAHHLLSHNIEDSMLAIRYKHQ